ncbi:restriction endonuclease [Paenarthrobacter sp. NPDC090517]|uniref:restriction endonuclease n=1 Tax=Paenarthrobacter sp. NPDC090517 TaxID=3364381 RepID=UPI003822636D
MAQQVNPALINPLIRVLSTAYWYRNELRDFLIVATGDRSLVFRYPWQDKSMSKRDLATALVHDLTQNQDKYRDVLVQLILTAADMPDPVSLKHLEDGARKYQMAREAIDVFHPMVEPYRKEQEEITEFQRRLQTQKDIDEFRRHTNQMIDDLKVKFLESEKMAAQPRGYALEGILNELFEVFNLESRRPFTAYGEQIDGSFTLSGTDYILEAKWQAKPIAAGDVTEFAGKVTRRLDNTLGLFISMSGFQKSVPDLVARTGRHSVLLMDGGDLMAVLDRRIALDELITRKKRHAAETGDIQLSAWTILGQL